ncbi:redoxin domain-containing protein [Flavicella sediminum]|uniref:redoxin domain-containing protein n=1 Tax=Flavicella sediminum TaxID=2585141 RepID=UPI0011213C99|nr:redoxin domain-containing protein [Flavicella sediminum]
MKTIFPYLKKNLKLELIKKKRSGIFTLSIILGAIIPLVFFIVRLFVYSKGIQKGGGIPVNYYFETLNNEALVGFSYFLFPILIIISASKITQIDHKNKGWNLMETQPTTKASIYFSKYLVLLASNLIAIVSLLFSVVVFAFLLSVFFELPSYKIVSIPFEDFFKVGARLFIVSLGVTAFQYSISVLISSFIWPLLVGFLAMSASTLMRKSNLIMNWYPFQQLGDVSVYPRGSDLGTNWFTFSELLSILYSVLFLFIGYSWYYHKIFIRAFFKSKKRSLSVVGVVTILGLLIYSVVIPKQQERSNKTVVKGTVSGNVPLKTFYVFGVLAQDTLAKIPIIDGEFRGELTGDLKFDTYFIEFEKYYGQQLFFGKNDSLQIDFKIYGRQNKIEITGTRLAENMKIKSSRRYSTVKYYLDRNINLDKDEFFVKEILREWELNLGEIHNKRTVDNFIPSDDYLARQTKIVSLRSLNNWDSYKEKVKKIFPNKIIKDADKLEDLENSVYLNDADLLSVEEYYTFVLKKLIQKDERIEVSDSQKHFEAIDKLEPSLFKDRLLFKHLKNSITNAVEIKTRDSLMNRYLSSIKKESYQKLLVKELYNQNRLTKGNVAPDFVASDTNGKTFELKDFNGKYLLIDIWGNWCKPCLQIAPKFKKKALQYKNKNIVFAKMNFGDSKAIWKVSSKKKDTLLFDLKPINEKLFIKNYNIKKYPTFILIDPEGKLISSDFSRPDYPLFDEILNKYLVE